MPAGRGRAFRFALPADPPGGSNRSKERRRSRRGQGPREQVFERGGARYGETTAEERAGEKTSRE